MKVKIFAAVTLTVVMVLVALNTVALEKIVDGTIREIDALDTGAESAESEAREIYEKFGRLEVFVSITVSHDDLTNIENCFSEMIGYLSVGMKDEAEVVKNRLRDSLTHLRRLVGINPDSII